MNIIKEILRWLLLLCVVLVALSAYYANAPLPLARTPFEFSLKQGDSLKAAAHRIKEAGGFDNEWLFVMLARCLGKERQIRPGNYQIEQAVSPLELLDIINKGVIRQTSFTIKEGITFNELRNELNSFSDLKHDSMILPESEILARIGAAEQHPEGLFFPDTYNFDKGSSDLTVLKRAYRLMQHHLEENWKQRDPGLPFETAYQALILASIVEKETGLPSDRQMIASVFINRLRKNMPLQADPTVIYGMKEKFNGNLRKKDLTTDTPYNTYTRKGLPPTPIAMPGLAALQAVLHPAHGKALYFVARGDGSSVFSNTLLEHNQAVRRYQLKQK